MYIHHLHPPSIVHFHMLTQQHPLRLYSCRKEAGSSSFLWLWLSGRRLKPKLVVTGIWEHLVLSQELLRPAHLQRSPIRYAVIHVGGILALFNGFRGGFGWKRERRAFKCEWGCCCSSIWGTRIMVIKICRWFQDFFICLEGFFFSPFFDLQIKVRHYI